MNQFIVVFIHPMVLLLLDHKDELTQIVEYEKELESKVWELIEKAELDKEEIPY